MILDNPYIFIIILLIVITYGFPLQISELFRSPIVRIAFLSLLVISSYEQSPLLLLTMAILYMVIMIQIGDEEDISRLVTLSAMKKLEQEKKIIVV